METKYTIPQDLRDSITRIFDHIGENSKREGLLKTPERVIKSYNKIFGGYNQKVEDVITTFDSPEKELPMVILKDIEFYSTCEHHMIPFFGKISVGYLPNKRVIGVSKIARIIEIYARRLQIQERLGSQIVEAINKHLEPLGVIVVIEAKHLCMVARGVEKQNSVMTTSSMSGAFEEGEVRAEFLQLIKGN